jgi:hypothetical protein
MYTLTQQGNLNGTLRRSESGREDNIKVDVKDIGFYYVGCIHKFQDMDHFGLL